METKAFEGWAIVELMGHVVLAGYVTQESIAGTAMLRIDVPEVEGQPGFTKYQSGGSIYGITPTTEEQKALIAEMHEASRQERLCSDRLRFPEGATGKRSSKVAWPTPPKIEA